MSNVKTQSYSSNGKGVIQERAYQFSISIIQFVDTFPNKRVYWVVADQLLRSATSIGANIVEAKASSSKREFIKFYEISLKSANETIYWITILRDAKLDVNLKQLGTLLSEAEQLGKMLGASLLTLKGKRTY